jgi:hypothetical protein
VLPTAKAKAFARYDFRHGRINELLEVSGNLPGVAYLAGHKQLTTTNAYLRSQRRQGDAVLQAAAALTGPQEDTMRAHTLDTDTETPGFPVGARGFEPPTPRPPVERLPVNTRDSSDSPREVSARNADETTTGVSVRARCGHTAKARPAWVGEATANLYELLVARGAA